MPLRTSNAPWCSSSQCLLTFTLGFPLCRAFSLSSSADAILPVAAAASSKKLPSSLPPQPDDAATPMTPASIVDLKDLSCVSRNASADDGSEERSPGSGAFLSQLFGEEAHKIFQPFL